VHQFRQGQFDDYFRSVIVKAIVDEAVGAGTARTPQTNRRTDCPNSGMTQPGVRDRETNLPTNCQALRFFIATAARLAGSQLESSPTFPTGATDNGIVASIPDAKFLGWNMVTMTAAVKETADPDGRFNCPAFV